MMKLTITILLSLMCGTSAEEVSYSKTVGGGTCESGYFPITSSWLDCLYAAESDIGYEGDALNHVNFTPSSTHGEDAHLEMEWWPEMPQGCFYDISRGSVQFKKYDTNGGYDQEIMDGDSIICSSIEHPVDLSPTYTRTAGATCVEGYYPITSSWQDCYEASRKVGYKGTYTQFVHPMYTPSGDELAAWDGVPHGCFYDGIRQRVQYNAGDGGNGRDESSNDSIICSSTPPEGWVPTTSSPTPSPTSSPTTLDINPFQVLAIGAGTAESPYGTATGIVGELVIDTFFEASSSDFNDGITIEVYSGVKDDEEDCTQGDLVPKTDYTTKSLPYADYSGPKATSDGVVGIARVTIPDFTTLPSIWFPVTEDNDDNNDTEDNENNNDTEENPVKDGVDKDGTIKLCVVTAINIDYYGTGKDYSVSQLHSKRSISVALVGSIEDGQFKQVIEVTESEATTSESKAVLGVAVETILCNNKNQPVSDDKSYVTGQLFRICVGATSDMVAKGMQVDQYLEVTCGERTLFSTEKGTDALTNIDDAKKNNKWAIHSVLTVEDAAAATVTDGTSTFTCRGKVSLSYTAPVVDIRALRNLLPTSTEVVVPSSGGAGAGAEAEAELEGLFDVTIQMETPSMNESSSAPPGPASMTTTRTTVVAVMGVVVGSLLSVVSFLLE